MNEKIIGWIAIAVILFSVGYIYKYEPFSPHVLQGLIISLIVLGAALRLVALSTARKTVIKRRRLYKEIWKREPHSLDKAEEDSVVLLGRIKGGKIPAALMLAGAALLLYYTQYIFGLTLALGQMYLAGRLLIIARGLAQRLPPDTSREPAVPLPDNANGAFLVDLDLAAVHDFILPERALPFWSLPEAQKWLIKSGFHPTANGEWKADKEALRILAADEIKSLKPAVDSAD